MKVKGLKNLHLRAHARWALDIDYADKLNEKDKAWLRQFLDEYYASGVRRPGNIHSPEQLKECWKTDKQRERAKCVMSLGLADFTEDKEAKKS